MKKKPISQSWTSRWFRSNSETSLDRAQENRPLLPPTSNIQQNNKRISTSYYASSSNDANEGDNKEDEQNNTGKAIIDLAVPALASLAIDPLLNLADTAFIGKTATDSAALAGVGSAAAILTFSFYIFNFFCTATTPIVSSKRASGNVLGEGGAVETASQALSLAIVSGIALSSALIICSQPLLNVMGTNLTGEEANGYATSFLTIRALAAPAVFVSSASIGILRGFLDTKTSLYVLFGANVVNFILDVVLIVGLNLGPTGAAIATTSAEWISALSLLGVISGKLPSADGCALGSNQVTESTKEDKDNLVLISVTPTTSLPQWNDMKPLLTASSSVFFRSFVLQICLASAAGVAARSVNASASVAAHQIAFQLWLLCSFVCDALAAASQALIADSIGRNDPKETKNIASLIFSYSLGLGLVLSVLLGVGVESGFVVDLFTSDESTRNALAPILLIIILSQPLNSLVFAADGVLQGASEFPYQAKTMFLSVASAIASFVVFREMNTEQALLVDVWEALIVLQIMRAFTSYLKVVDKDGPIKLS